MILSGRRLVMARLDAQRSRQMRQSDDRRENSGGTSVMHAFTIASSRPPRGLAMLTGPLGLRGAFAAYNGSALLRRDLSVIEQHLVPAEAARLARSMPWAGITWASGAPSQRQVQLHGI